MEQDKEYFRYVLYFLFKFGKNATQAYENICVAHGGDVISRATCYNWINRFKQGNFSVENKPKSGRPVKIDDNKLQQLIEKNPDSSTRELGDLLGVSKTTIDNHLHQLGFSKHLDLWVPHQLSEKNLYHRIDVCQQLKTRNERNPFLKELVVGGEKWLMYDNTERKQCTKNVEPVPKLDMHKKKALLCVWWNYQGVIFYELLSFNETVDADKYCQQLELLHRTIEMECPKDVVFQHDNDKVHTTAQTRKKLIQLSFDVLAHPEHSPDVAPTDYHLFRDLQQEINGNDFKDLNELQEWVDNYFKLKPTKFYEDGIMQLPQRWQKIIANNGQYSAK